MSKQTEALKLALEPVMSVYITKDGIEDWWHKLPEGRYDLCDITAIREALAEQPAKCKHNVFAPYRCTQCEAEQPASNVNATGGPKAFFSLAKQPAQQQEPVAWGMPSAGGGFVVDCITPEEHDRVDGGYTIPLYTSPQPSKPWVGLTPAEAGALWKVGMTPHESARAIEAKLREKNA